MRRVVVHAGSCQSEPPILGLLEAEGFDVVACPDARALLEEVMQRAPDSVIYALQANCHEDLGVLQLMRRAIPDVPLVLLACEDSLETRRLTQSLRPTYYAMCPVDGAELLEVMRATLTRRGRTP